jgi:hypothetical protein
LSAYPVRSRRVTLPTVRLVGEVGAVLEMHGHPPVRALADVLRLREALFGFMNVDQAEPGSKKGAAQ